MTMGGICCYTAHDCSFDIPAVVGLKLFSPSKKKNVKLYLAETVE